MAVCRISPTIGHGQLDGSSVRLHNNQSYVYIYASCDENAPNLRYNKNTFKWQFSNNGATWADMGPGTGSIGDDSTKIIEIIQAQIPINTNHSLPNSNTYTMASGSKLDIYLNGQLLSHDKNNTQYDYVEVNNTTVKFHLTIVNDTILAYIIK